MQDVPIENIAESEEEKRSLEVIRDRFLQRAVSILDLGPWESVLHPEYMSTDDSDREGDQRVARSNGTSRSTRQFWYKARVPWRTPEFDLMIQLLFEVWQTAVASYANLQKLRPVAEVRRTETSRGATTKLMNLVDTLNGHPDTSTHVHFAIRADILTRYHQLRVQSQAPMGERMSQEFIEQQEDLAAELHQLHLAEANFIRRANQEEMSYDVCLA